MTSTTITRMLPVQLLHESTTEGQVYSCMRGLLKLVSSVCLRPYRKAICSPMPQGPFPSPSPTSNPLKVEALRLATDHTINHILPLQFVRTFVNFDPTPGLLSVTTCTLLNDVNFDPTLGLLSVTTTSCIDT